MASKLPFSKGDYVVYPTHGVGKVMGVEKQEIAGFQLQLFVISFDSEKTMGSDVGGCILTDDDEQQFRAHLPAARIVRMDAGHNVQEDQPRTLAALVQSI